jgi:PAS domain S-box-containing protein
MKTRDALETENLALIQEIDALRLLLAQGGSPPKGGDDEILHDLQVHQEELRAQNEELQQAQERIERVSAQNRDLFDYSPVGYFVINESYVVVDANISGLKMLNKDKSRVAGKPFILFFDKKSRRELDGHFLRTKITGRSLSEVWLSPNQRPAFPVILESVKLGNEWGVGWRCLTTAMDITERKKAEVAEKSHSVDLERARDRLALIIDCMSQHIAVLDSQGRIAKVNKAWREFSEANNGPPNFCIGDVYGSVCGGSDASECPPELTPHAILDVINGRLSGISLEYPCHSPDEKRWFRLDISPITGLEPGAVISHTNITARKLMEMDVQRSRDRFSDFAKASSDWYWEMDAELRFTWVSGRFGAATGLDPVSIIGKTRDSMIAEIDQAELSRYHDDLYNRRPFKDFDYMVVTPLGRKFLRICGVPVFDLEGGFVGYRGTGTDVTEIKKIEIQLRESKLTAETANKAKSDFLSNMSHELRTPLNAVLGFAEVLQAGYDTPLTDKQRGYVDHILAGGSHLLDLINEVLDLAKVEAGAMTQERTAVDLGSVIKDCVSLSSPIFAKYEVTPVNEAAEFNATILADPQHTKQLILNLLSNAAKYNRRGGTVTISCETIENEFHRLIIADTGKGIPDHMQDQMFKPFNRLGADATATEGTGIGLALTKSIIEAMGGRIGFSSVVDEGSRFWLDFPLCDDKVESPAVATEGGGRLHYCFEDRLVLYIEDNVFNMRLMEALFEQLAPMRLITATNAEDGLILARSSQPDVILLDINLPGINGFEAVARLKHDALIRHIPVVGLSADATSATAERALNSGFVDYLTKPVNLSELIRTLSRAMEGKFVTHK